MVAQPSSDLTQEKRGRLQPMAYAMMVGAIALACFLSAHVVMEVLNLGLTVSPVWVPAGIALAVLLLYGRRVWPGITLGALLFALSLGASGLVAVVAALGSTLEALLAQWLLQRWHFHPSLRKLRDVLKFIGLAVLLAPTLNATISSVNAGLAGLTPWSNLGLHWWTVWMGDGMGILVFTPLLLLWLGNPLPALPGLSSRLPNLQTQRQLWQRTVEALLWAICLVGVSWLVFESTPDTAIARYPLEYLPFPFIVWAALRLGQRATVLASLVVSVIAIWGAVHQTGPFIGKAEGDLVQTILLLQAFIGVMTVTALVLSAAVSERWDSEERFRSMFEGAAIGIGLDDQQGRIVESNPALQAMLGYSREALQNMTFADFTHPDDLTADIELFQEMLAGQRESYQLEKRHLRQDGQIVWVRLTNSVVRDEAGNPRFTIGMVENITTRKQAEAALQLSEARFRVIAETAACAIVVYQGSFLRYVNPAMETITGYSREELLTIPFWELAHPDFRDLVHQRGLARQQGEALPSRYEIKLLTKDGQERWVDFTAGLITYEGKPAGLATAYDITDRKLAEAKLQLAAERERLLAQIALRIRSSLDLAEILNITVAEVRQFLKADRVFISHFGPGGHCQIVAESVAPQWNSLMNWVSEEQATQEVRALFAPYITAADSLNRPIRVVNDTSQIEQTPFLQAYYQLAQVKAGIGVPLLVEGEMFGVLIVNQCSGPRQWTSLETDLLQQLATQVEIAIQQGQLYEKVQRLASSLETKVEERTTELKQRMQELQQLNQIKDMLLHAVSHDLKTPLQGMLMALNRLQSRCQGSTISLPASMVDCMIQSCNQQLNLLNSLMEQHCQNEAQMVLKSEPIALPAYLTTVLDSLHPLLSQNRATIINHLSPDLPPVQADPTLLRFVFEQLLTNAVNHNRPGVTITLSAIALPPETLQTLGCTQTGGQVAPTPMLYCTVEDNGTGLSPEQCDRLFQLYVRGLDNPHRTGIGLGLQRCHKIIAAHGGQIGVISQPGCGSTFWFTLPLTSAHG